MKNSVSKRKNSLLILLLILLRIATVEPVMAQNPIVQTMYTADPAPMVWNDRLYLYTTHHAEVSTWFTTDDCRLYSITAMENTIDRGIVIVYSDFGAANGPALIALCSGIDG